MTNYQEDFKKLWLYDRLKNQLSQDSVSHAHFFVCEDEFSAKTFSDLVARLLLCENMNACGTCAACVQVNAQTHPDLFILPKEKTFMVASAAHVVENAYKKPIAGERKVFLINNFDKANESAQNKILKILEEPPKNTFFMLNGTNDKKVLSTILSRVQKHFVPPFKADELQSILKNNNVKFNQNILDMSDGYLGRALALAENKDFLHSYDFVLNMLAKMTSSKDIINFSAEFSERSLFLLRLEILEKVFRNMLLIKNQSENLIDDASVLLISPLSAQFSNLAIINILNKIIKAKMLFDASVNITSITDNLLLGILEDKFLWK